MGDSATGSRPDRKNRTPGGESDFSNVVPFDEISPSERLDVSLDGFEGPLDLLLSLARTQKVDLTKISILEARRAISAIHRRGTGHASRNRGRLPRYRRLARLSEVQIAASRRGESRRTGPSGEEMALHLAFRLKRLDAMRDAVARLFGRKQLGIDIFSQGHARRHPYGQEKRILGERLRSCSKPMPSNGAATPWSAPVKMGGRQVWSVREARELPRKLFGKPRQLVDPGAAISKTICVTTEVSKTALASSFGATFEMSREGFHRASPGAAFRADLCSLAEEEPPLPGTAASRHQQ